MAGNTLQVQLFARRKTPVRFQKGGVGGPRVGLGNGDGNDVGEG